MPSTVQEHEIAGDKCCKACGWMQLERLKTLAVDLVANTESSILKLIHEPLSFLNGGESPNVGYLDQLRWYVFYSQMQQHSVKIPYVAYGDQLFLKGTRIPLSTSQKSN